ncbi:MAG: hypothetical protein HZB75_04725 [Candidatus Saccharibacteria bacterium]|nr:MAG: hypothetical protein HZB75_04725 [Candidatus Saccharibacteria bacterium]
MKPVLDLPSPNEQNEKINTPETEKYHDLLRDNAEQFLAHPALEKLIVASEALGRLTDEDMAELVAAREAGKAEYLRSVAKLVQKAMDWRTAPDGTILERWETPKDSDLPPEYCEAIKQAGIELMMNDEVPVPNKKFSVGAVFGATVVPIAKRTDFFYDSLEDGVGQIDTLINLGAERPLGPVDRKNAEAYPYVNNASVETDLLDLAAIDWYTRHGYAAPKLSYYSRSTALRWGPTYDTTYNIHTIDAEQSRPDWAPEMSFSLSAPYDKTHHPRANTGETLDFAMEITEVKPGDTMLVISHQPYLLGQLFEAQRVGIDHGVQVEGAGYGNLNPALPATVWGGEIAKAATKANELLEAIAQAEAASSQEMPLAA